MEIAGWRRRVGGAEFVGGGNGMTQLNSSTRQTWKTRESWAGDGNGRQRSQTNHTIPTNADVDPPLSAEGVGGDLATKGLTVGDRWRASRQQGSVVARNRFRAGGDVIPGEDGCDDGGVGGDGGCSEPTPLTTLAGQIGEADGEGSADGGAISGVTACGSGIGERRRCESGCGRCGLQLRDSSYLKLKSNKTSKQQKNEKRTMCKVLHYISVGLKLD
uniref:DUF834 domain-containing protein n=1 Tax=Oryza punctata TaxID=4537 RepID=A0A0E0KXL1_ORYPU